jgi:predicted nucleic acid-binding protein
VKIVFDSSIWISALEYGGLPRQAILQAGETDTILICDQIESEVIRIMSGKFVRKPLWIQSFD